MLYGGIIAVRITGHESMGTGTNHLIKARD